MSLCQGLQTILLTILTIRRDRIYNRLSNVNPLLFLKTDVKHKWGTRRTLHLRIRTRMLLSDADYFFLFHLLCRCLMLKCSLCFYVYLQSFLCLIFFKKILLDMQRKRSVTINYLIYLLYWKDSSRSWKEWTNFSNNIAFQIFTR